MTEENRQFGLSHRTELGGDEERIVLKNAWPEVVGLTAEDAEKRIKEDKPEAHVQVVPPNHIVTADYNEGRVRIFIDLSGRVFKAPVVG
ncbi:Potato inhibitor I family [Musa troglodytarum]|uniref:Potato inhibitor I family n=1 Tax=Musa troglodytarum TaxID=320322 RepID=A0A9E7KFU5_9LILI|nr:Potato inhibitor I family [Musa troglodytarum]